ncbi:MAG: MerR family transcriptional regulator [Gammaproteobacteria bacterium]|jgi:DNA-binding transcriptional MerR regulator|nr:MerR family transcriptional regulator [Gammaproteobacteria bacterium]
MMTVSELSRQGRVAPHVVRYYSRIGLLSPARHPDNGYKLFSRSDISRLSFIRQAQSLGCTLEEIAQILDTSAQGKSPCRRVRDILQRHVEENRQKLEELLQLQNRMEDALRQWDKMPDRVPDRESICHLIESTGIRRYDA